MREIKFRVWVNCPNISMRRMRYNPLMGMMCGTLNEAIRQCSFGKTGDDCWENILMQFTGLKDKNGKEIYEGDIVKCFDEKLLCGIGVVKYGKFESSHEAGYSRFHYHIGFYIVGTDSKQIWDSSNEDIKWQEVEIIGNIHENPELLKNN